MNEEAFQTSGLKRLVVEIHRKERFRPRSLNHQPPSRLHSRGILICFEVALGRLNRGTRCRWLNPCRRGMACSPIRLSLLGGHDWTSYPSAVCRNAANRCGDTWFAGLSANMLDRVGQADHGDKPALTRRLPAPPGKAWGSLLSRSGRARTSRAPVSIYAFDQRFVGGLEQSRECGALPLITEASPKTADCLR